ncbi:Histone-lysine N-methyltransferase EZA1 [Linum grandiflorum]
MESKSSESTSSFHEEESSGGSDSLRHNLKQLVKDIQDERALSVKGKIEKNRKKLARDMSRLELGTSSYAGMEGDSPAISTRIEDPLWVYSGFVQETGDRDNCNVHEGLHWTDTKLPGVEKIPKYTSWMFLDRNQKMTEDQSVVGRRRIYYAQNDGEALICSDSEEEIPEPEEEKHEFSEAEDRVIWTAFQEGGLRDSVVDLLTKIIGVRAMEIRERCSFLKEKFARDRNLKNIKEPGHARGINLEKSLSAALDSFDNLFCRRCLVFDCRLHGCSQTVIIPNEKLPYLPVIEDDTKPCSAQCYLQLKVEEFPEHGTKNSEERGKSPVTLGDSDGGAGLVKRKRSAKGKLVPSEAACHRETNPQTRHTDVADIVKGMEDTQKLKRKVLCQTYIEEATSIMQVAFNFHDSSCKKHKESFSGDVIPESEGVPTGGFGPSSTKNTTDIMTNDNSPSECTLKEVSSTRAEKITGAQRKKVTNVLQRDHSAKSTEWKVLEKDLYLKGVEIFGKNRLGNC